MERASGYGRHSLVFFLFPFLSLCMRFPPSSTFATLGRPFARQRRKPLDQSQLLWQNVAPKEGKGKKSSCCSFIKGKEVE
jgi:hypothetical protein